MLYSIVSHLEFLSEPEQLYVRMLLSAFTAFLITFLAFPKFIHRLKIMSFGQEIRDDGPKSHFSKKGTPTMGGLLLVLACVVSCSLWGSLQHLGLFLVLMVMAGYACIGFIDDFYKVKKSNTKGLSPSQKLVGQIVIGLGALLLYAGNFESLPYSSTLSLPGLFSFETPLWLYIPFALFIIVGTSNGTNLTDGLDGLLIGPVMLSALAFLIMILCGADPALMEIGIFCAALGGASLGFLWYNTYPAAVFMGDVGSLALGGALAMVAILTHNELISALLHGVFLIEVVSVIVQVFSFKVAKRRVFKMSPLHHHFELSGWPEPKVVVRFWILAALFASCTVIIKVWP
ncbi:MAG: phospho-N-acetylmuramoyl-pentapeptide-transferase [Myxococcales bacterium]|nr:phospho-N-acetylmuramoyl-pentapeptide-transferase [Myxococcales bacterium]USN51298.1 MAG: phospho-N-acetylmuramoyl-pentapeptide-transferase [Myxococcales bacterium]